MFLNAKGFDFAPHPMLVETDRDRYCIQEIVDFYGRQNTDYADYFRAAWTYKHRAVFGNTQRDACRHCRAAEGQREVPDDDLEDARDEGRDRPVGEAAVDVARAPRSEGRAACCERLRIPGVEGADLARDGANRMRDFVVRMRKDTSLVFGSPTVKGLSVRTQPLMNWKLRAYATHRRDFDRAALRVEGEAPPVEPTIPLGRDGKPVGYGLVGTRPQW